MAATLPGTELLIGAQPVDEHAVTWTLCTDLPQQPNRARIDFGTFTWVRRLHATTFDRDADSLRLADGSTLRVTGRTEHASETRYRLRSLADPTRTVSGTGSWADLPAVEQIAVRVYERLLAPADATGAAMSR